VKRLVIITVLLFTFAALTACAESEYELVPYCTEYELAPYLKIYQLARDATYIVRAAAFENNNDYTINLGIQGVYKGGPHLRGIIELRISADAGDILLDRPEWSKPRSFLFFLQSVEDGIVELLDDYHSVYELVSLNTPYIFRNINRSIHGQDGFELEIHYHDLLEIWNAQMQSVFETYTQLEFNARRERGGQWQGQQVIETLEYPVVITSMDDLAKYMDLYSKHTLVVLVNGFHTRVYSNDLFFGMYTEEFFEENFLVVFYLRESSTSTRHRVNAVLENGDIYLTRLVSTRIASSLIGPPGVTMMAHSYIILEINSRTIPEQFNLIINNRWL